MLTLLLTTLQLVVLRIAMLSMEKVPTLLLSQIQHFKTTAPCYLVVIMAALQVQLPEVTRIK